MFIHIGSFELRSYGVLGASGFLLGAMLGLRYADRRGWSREAVVDLIFWSSLSAIAGSRLFFLAQAPGSFAITSLFDLRSGGMVFYGAPLLGVPVFLAVARRHGLPPLALLDGLGIFAPMSHAISRLGCMMAGCCYGAPSAVPWAVTYSDPLSAAPLGVPMHPVQLYEAAGLLALAGANAMLDRRKPWVGRTGLSWLGGYAALRFVVELARGDAERGFVGPLSTSQAIAVGVLVGVGVAWTWLSRRAVDGVSGRP